MNKSILWTFILVVTGLGFTGFSFKTGPNIGNYSPELVLEKTNEKETVRLSQFKGKPTLVNFWDTKNASSRLQEKQYQLFLASDTTNHTELNYLSVNIDKNPAVAREIAKIDCYNPKTLYFVANNVQSVVRKFGMKQTPKAFLIDKDGEIIAINPTDEQLRELI